MFEGILNFFKKIGKSESKEEGGSKNKAKERLHLVLMQDRANVSADFLEMMKQEIIDVIKKYIEVEEREIDVRLTNEVKDDGTTGAPSLYANIPIVNIRNDMKKEITEEDENKVLLKSEEIKKEDIKEKSEQEQEENIEEDTEKNVDKMKKDVKEENKTKSEEKDNAKKTEKAVVKKKTKQVTAQAKK